MKKFLVTIIAFIYLGVSSGVAMNIHYCMGKISSVDLMQLHSKKKCGNCGMNKSDGGCCKDEFKIVKLSDAQKLISNEVNIALHVAVINDFNHNFKSDAVFSRVNSSVNNNSPPSFPSVSLYILYAVFII